MKKQHVSLKKLNFSTTKVASVTIKNVMGGTILDMTDNGCGPEQSVWPNVCPVSHNCPPATHTCQTVNCNSFACESFACVTVVCHTQYGCF